MNELVQMGLITRDARKVRENMTEEELVIFDILTRPAPELNTEERDEIKKVAHELLTRLKELLILARHCLRPGEAWLKISAVHCLHLQPPVPRWRQGAAARSQVRLTIEDVLDTGLPRACTPEVYQTKCSAIFEHVYENYSERSSGTTM